MRDRVINYLENGYFIPIVFVAAILMILILLWLLRINKKLRRRRRWRDVETELMAVDGMQGSEFEYW